MHRVFGHARKKSMCTGHSLSVYIKGCSDSTTATMIQRAPSVLASTSPRRLDFMARSEHEMQGECYELHHMTTVRLILAPTGRTQISIFRRSVCGASMELLGKWIMWSGLRIPK